MFFFSRLKSIAEKDLLQTLQLWKKNFQPILNTVHPPELTASNSIILLCFTQKYSINLEEKSINDLSNIICQKFQSLSLNELKLVFWLYNQNTSIYPPLFELMYESLNKDLCGLDKQQDEKNIRDVFFILIAGAKLKWEVETNQNDSITPSEASQQQMFINWLKKSKIYPLGIASKQLLALMDTTSAITEQGSGKIGRKKKKGNRVAQQKDNKNDWDILQEAEKQA